MTLPRLIVFLLVSWVIGRADAGAQPSLSASVHPANELVLRTWSPEYPSLGPSYGPSRGPVMEAHAAHLLAERPDAPETFEILVYMERPAEALGVLARLIERHPDQIAGPFTVLRSRQNIFLSEPYAGQLRALGAAARTRLKALPRAAAADASLRILLVELRTGGPPATQPPLAPALEAFIQEYAGTPATLLAEIEIIKTNRNRVEQVASLEAFARAHPGTIAAAHALYEAAFQLANSVVRGGQDPTESFLRVFEIVRELESGRYPASEWVAKAPYLGLELYSSKPVYATGNAERLLAAYRDFVRTHFMLPGHDSVDFGIGYVINTRMGDLFALAGDRRAGVEQALSELEAVHAPRARYLRADSYLKGARTASPAERAALVQQAAGILMALRKSEGNARYGRKALAMLASLAFEDREYAAARAYYQEYLAAHPETDWSWVAAVKVGRTEDALGNRDAAIAAYRIAAVDYASLPPARVLGSVYAARASEALGRFADALTDYERAVNGWAGGSYTLNEHGVPEPGQPVGRDVSAVTHVSVTERITELRRFASAPGGDLLERGRLLLEQGRHADARPLLEQAAAAAAQPAVVVEARSLAHRARVEQALGRFVAGATAAAEAAAVAEFDAVAADAYDFGVAAAKIAKASLLFRQGSIPQARALMTDALGEWRDRQASLPAFPSPLADDLAGDVADVRAALFRPAGDGSMSGEIRVAAGDRFVIVNTDVFVKEAGGERRRVAVFQSFPAVPNALVMTTSQIDLLERMLTRLAGDERAAADRMLAFWDSFFPARRGFMPGGWILEAPPQITSIEFTNPERTRASVGVSVGFAGGTFHLERTQAGWQLREITNRSIV